MCPLRAESCFPQPSGSPESKPFCLQSQTFCGLIFPVQDSKGGKLDVGLSHLAPWGDCLQLFMSTNGLSV